MAFGDLGNPQHNVALLNAKSERCLINMAYLVCFQMFGSIVANKFISFCKLRYKGGDLKSVHDFLIQVGDIIDLERTPKKIIPDKLKAMK